jgi:hypothetical protein
MPRSAAATVEEYLAELPEDRRAVISAVRDFVREHLPEGYREVMAAGMIAYVIPLERYPKTYNKQPLCYVSIASQKNYCSLHLVTLYMDPGREARFRQGFAEAGKRLDMGKGCVRFRKAEDLALDAVAEVVAAASPDEFIAAYEAIKSRSR